MPRVTRVKECNSIYHIIIRGMQESGLFKGDLDKDKYLSFIKRSQQLLKFKVYGYCLLSHEGHLIIDNNGADISRIMGSINQPYVQYFNRKYQRSGPLFLDRYKSLIIKDTPSLITLTQYIHNFPKLMGDFKQVEQFKYSTLGSYLSGSSDELGLLDDNYLSDFFTHCCNSSKEEYLAQVYLTDDDSLKAADLVHKKSEYKSYRTLAVKARTPQEILHYVSEFLGIDENCVNVKNSRKSTEAKAIITFLMRNLFGYSYDDICDIIGSLSQNRVSKLSSLGCEMLFSKEQYTQIKREFYQRENQV